MGEILSHSEVEAILSALDFSSTAAHAPVTPLPDSQAEIQALDFEHPIPLRPLQLNALRFAGATATSPLQSGLEEVLRTSVIANFLAVEQSTYRDFLATSENPACLARLESTESLGVWLVDISRSLAFTIVDCTLGGSPSVAGSPPTRPFTVVETRLIEKTLIRILRDLNSDILRTQSLQMTQLVSDAALISEATLNEAVALVSFEIVCGCSQGLIQLCVPWKEIASALPNGHFEGRLPSERAQSAAAKLPVIATARIAKLKLSAHDLANLSLGDVLLTDAESSAELCLEVDGREICRGTAGQSRDRKVILVSASPVSETNK